MSLDLSHFFILMMTTGKFCAQIGLFLCIFPTYLGMSFMRRLVFQDEGVSLQKLLYSVTISKVSAVVEPSLLWRKLRSTKGASSLRGIMHQVIASLAALHQRGVTHRDVKPSNILLNTEAAARILMADFSSAVSEDALSKGLYGKFGPLIDEETLQYAPPEVLLSISTDNVIPYDLQHPHSYDSWSVGVVFLEMILGTSDVFTVDQRTAAMIAHRMKRTAGVDDKKLSDAMLLAALADYCIYRREDSYEEDRDLRTGLENDKGQEVGSGLIHPNQPSEVLLSPLDSAVDTDSSLSVMAVQSTDTNSQILRSNRRRNERLMHQDLHPMVQSRVCGLEDLRLAVLRRDPLGTGISDQWQLDLISRLLRWEPTERMTMADGKSYI